MKLTVFGITVLFGSIAFASDSAFFQSMEVRSMERITGSLYKYTEQQAKADALEQCRSRYAKCILVSQKTELNQENGQSETVASSAVVKGE